MRNIQKRDRYERIIAQLKNLFEKTQDPISRMSTISAVLHHKFNYFFWTGFYLLKDGELSVGPYQGSVACLVLKKDTGVCWSAINDQKTVIVADVHEFPGHIACDSRSRSEIVVPVHNKENKIIGVLDIDSKALSSFDSEDKNGLEKIVKLII